MKHWKKKKIESKLHRLIGKQFKMIDKKQNVKKIAIRIDKLFRKLRKYE